ncbi:hypothetical protein DFQ30_002218 [Apophysomyces sp. BC1015]|nr:hypothetical protein DFQ30_002218 [Apophysomyces sp. BC1015]
MATSLHHIIAPCPKKPLRSFFMDEMEWSHEDACQELRQILETHPVMLSIKADEQLIVRTGNPLPQDSSFIPLHQAVSHLQVSEKPSRPRSFSVGDQIPCKPVH